MNNPIRYLAFFAFVGVQVALADIKIGTGTPHTVNDSELDYLKYGRYMTVPFAIQEETNTASSNYITWHSGDNPDSKTEAQIHTAAQNIKALEGPASTDRQVEIYNRMKIGVTIGGSVVKEDFLFDSADHAMRSVKQRIETINKFIEFSADPANTSFTYISRDGTHKFTSDWQPGLRENRLLLSQKSNNPYDAIYQLCTTNNGTTGECLGASHASILWGISQAMGKTAFNNLYGSPANQLNLANFYKKHVKAATASQLYIPGDEIYFLNSNYGDIAQTQALVKYFPTVDIQVPLFTLAGGTTVTKTVAVPNYLYFAGENCFYVGNMDGTADSFAVLTGRTVKHYTLAEMITLLQTEYNDFVDPLIVKLDAERPPDYTHTGSNTPQFIDKSHKPSPRTVLLKHIGTANIGDITKSEHERPMYNPQP